jgi:acyl-CoA synthetase (AMP-forming)/AMP-acid ligase II
MTGLTIGSVFRNAARAVPNRPAAALDDAVLTFREIDAQADRIAYALAARGIGRGDRVLCWTGTLLEMVPVFAALARVGAAYCPLPGMLQLDEAKGICEVADPTLVLFDADHADGAQLQPGVQSVLLDDLLAEAAAHSGEHYPDVSSETDPHVLFFTSGSTGRPKGVVLSHRVNYLRTHPGSQVEPRGAMICVYPLFHMGAWTIALQQWQARDLVVFVSRTDGPHICALVRKHAATRLNAVPAIWQRLIDTLAKADEPAERVLPTIEYADGGTSATPPALLDGIARACPNAYLRVFYGSTEAGNVASLTGDDIGRKPHSCGLPSTASEVRIDAESGELCVRGPLLFDGYYGNPVATANAIQDGWYRTGDLATVDDEGYLRIVGRAHDLIRTGGESVVPTEVETTLTGLAGVAELAVIGMPDDTWGEVVCLVIVPHPGAPVPSIEAVREHCSGRLAAFKHPRLLHTVDALPRTPATGQIQRRLLVEKLRTTPHPVLEDR